MRGGVDLLPMSDELIRYARGDAVVIDLTIGLTRVHPDRTLLTNHFVLDADDGWDAFVPALIRHTAGYSSDAASALAIAR